MKKFLLALTALGSVLALALPASALDVTITAGGTAGSWFISGSAFQDAFSQQIKGSKFSVVPGGGAANPIRVNRGEAQVGMTYSTNAKSAIAGEDPYKEKLTNVKAMVNLQIIQYLVVAASMKAPVGSFEEWISKKAALRVLPGPRAMGGWMAFQRLVKEYGAGVKDMEGWGCKFIHAGWSESSQQLLDGHAEVIAPQAPVKVPFMVDLAQSRDLKYFSVSEKIGKALEDKYGYSLEPMPAQTYKGQDKELPCVADSVVLIAGAQVPDDLVYQMVKIICENKPRWEATHAMFKPFDPTKSHAAPIPLHPGAAKYYKEKGYLK